MKLKALLTLPLLVLACSKNKNPEKVLDPDQELIPKSHFSVGDPSNSLFFSKITVVKTSGEDEFMSVGLVSQLKIGYFEFKKNTLSFYNLDYNSVKENQMPKEESQHQWRIDHIDFEKKKVNGQRTEDETIDTSNPWRNKKFFKIDFEHPLISEENSFAIYNTIHNTCWVKKSTQLVENSFYSSNEYITFTISVDYQENPDCNTNLRRLYRNDYTYNVHYKYSFVKYNKTDYIPYTYSKFDDPELKRFGFFNTNTENYDKESREKQLKIFMNRRDPEKTHIYYFTKDFPEEFKWIFNDPKYGIFEKTNQLLKDSGSKMRIKILENTAGDGKIKEFGDGRYSFIHAVDNNDESSVLGFGPLDAHPWTGEIIQANVVIWVNSLRDSIVKANKRVELSKLIQETSPLVKIINKILSDNSQEHSDPSNSLLLSESYVSNLKPSDYENLNEYLRKKTFSYAKTFSFTHEQRKNTFFDFSILERSFNYFSNSSSKQLFQEVKMMKPELDSSIFKLNSSNFPFQQPPPYPYFAAAPFILTSLKSSESVQKILNTIFYRVSLHELGHNLGLRHNFYGSIDINHFGSYDKNNKLINPNQVSSDQTKNIAIRKSNTSSVMDYMLPESEINEAFDWEPYDRAALSFAYGTIKPKETDHFLYCSDEHIIINPLCNKYSSGSSPSEIVVNTILTYDKMYHLRNLRGNQAYWDKQHYTDIILNIMLSIKKLVPFEKNITKNLTSPEIKKDIHKAILLSIAFFKGIISLENSDRPIFSKFDPFTGEEIVHSLLIDKVLALIFLLGEIPITYDISQSKVTSSYLNYWETPEINVLLRKTVLDQLSTFNGSQMPLGSMTLSQYIFGANASNELNEAFNLPQIFNQFNFSKFTSDELKNYFKIELNSSSIVQRLTLKNPPTFPNESFVQNSEVAIIYIGENSYLMASKDKNPVAYKILVNSNFENDSKGITIPSGFNKSDIMELYNINQLFSNQVPKGR